MYRANLAYVPLAQLVEQLTLNQWVLGSSPRWCTKECLTRKCRVFFCCSILRRHDLVQRRRYSNRAAARSAVRNATVRRSLARGRVPDGAPRKAATNVAAFLLHHSLRDGLALRASARVRLAGTLLFTHRLLWNNGSWSANYFYILQITPLPTPPPIWLRWRRWQVGAYSLSLSFAAY